MKRIHVHWTAGRHSVSATDRKHYHFIVAGDGSIIDGVYEPEANEDVSDGIYAAHTLGANSGAIGIALAGMMGAKESPFESGPYPIRLWQFNTMCQLVAKLCKQYKIEVAPATVLTHAEVEGTLKIKQKGKWDITRLPFEPKLIGAKACGDYMRGVVKNYLKSKQT